MENSWILLAKELWGRFARPWGQVSFVLYFLMAIIIGGFGVWFTLVQGVLSNWGQDTLELFFRAVLTYFPAIGALACVQVAIMEDDHKYMRAFFMLLLIIFVILALISGLFYSRNSELSFVLVLIGTFLALVSWWVVNSQEDRLMDTPEPTAALGGSSEEEPAGDTEDYKL